MIFVQVLTILTTLVFFSWKKHKWKKNNWKLKCNATPELGLAKQMNTDPSGSATLIYVFICRFLITNSKIKSCQLMLPTDRQSFQEHNVNFSDHTRNLRQKDGQDNIRVGPCLAHSSTETGWPVQMDSKRGGNLIYLYAFITTTELVNSASKNPF
jgi:hypothetical protein